MIGFRTVDMAPAQARYALGYACVCAWAVILLIAPVFGIGSPAVHAAPASMLPGLITCLASLVFTKQFPSIAGRTGMVALERGTDTIYEATKEKGEFDYGKNVL